MKSFFDLFFNKHPNSKNACNDQENPAIKYYSTGNIGKITHALIILVFGVCRLGFAESPSSAGTIDFSGGLNVGTISTLIADNESPDMCNCSPEQQGAMTKRNGSKRFNLQSVSSNPITSLQRVYTSSGPLNYKGILATSRDKIYYSSTDFNPQLIVISSNLAHNQHYSYVTMNGKVVITGDGLSNNVKLFDIATASITDAFQVDQTSAINPRGKYQIVSKNYYLMANVAISTASDYTFTSSTFFPSRTLFSRLNNPSSMTVQRFIDFKSNDGEEITGLGNMFDNVNIFKPSSIGELSFNVLDLPSLGGDFTFQEVVTGFGCIAPRTLANTGQFYVFLAKDGIRLWDGGRRTRLDVRQESRIISNKIKPLIDDLIRSGRYQNAVGIYYPKKEWYIFSFESPNRFPKGRNNYILVYDFQSDSWFPFCNWLADSFTIADNAGDTGQLYYGDSNDGYIHMSDLDIRADDSRKESSIDVMDSSFTWVGSSQDVVNVQEGTASVKVQIYSKVAGVTSSSMTRMGIFQFGEWYDKSRVTTSDKISFKAFPSSLPVITSLRIDLEVKQAATSFDSNFSSVTLSSSAFSGNRAWTQFEIPIGSFPVRSDWTDLTIESVPFANRFNAYGIRFVLSGIDISSVSIDDLRIVQGTDNPVRMTRTTKLYDFKTMALKSFGAILLTMDKASDSSFYMDMYNDFGTKLRGEKFDAEVPKEIVIFHPNNAPGMAILNSIDYTVKKQTATVGTHWDCKNGVMDAKYIVCGDRIYDKLIRFDRANLSTFSLTYGSYGSGTGNFNLIHEIAEYSGGYLVSDLVNQRIKVHSLNNLGFLKQYGSLGNGTTNFHQPTGVSADLSNYYVSDEGNNRLTVVSQDTFSILRQALIDHNALADSSLIVDAKNTFMAYNKFSESTDDTLDLILEKRDKGNLELLTKVIVKPLNVSTGSYRTNGSIGQLGRYVYIPFTNDEGQAGGICYYIQKRLKDTLEIVSEYATDKLFYSSIGYGLSYNPLTSVQSKILKSDGRYIQFKFYDDFDNALDNYWRLYNIVPLANVQPLAYP